MLKGKNVLLGVCGSIAAYKSAFLIRLLVKAGANVKVILTKDATGFITPLTLSVLSKNPVLIELQSNHGEWNNHVELGLWADLFVIAPTSANTLAKMATGLCDNLLMATYLSAKCPVWVAPAMDLDMYKHPATSKNLNTLTNFGIRVLPAGRGELASGLEGEGRMREPEDIFNDIEKFFSHKSVLTGKHILVNAGPTYERIDPVRFIGNFSSGKMGFAIAEELAMRGAKVSLVSGPVHLETNQPLIKRINVTTAEEMYKQCIKIFAKADAAILSAAVADYSPSVTATQKIKKNESTFSLELKKTKDIAASLGSLKKPRQRIIGFALETENEKVHALQKLKKKNFDAIVLNSMNDRGAGFGGDSNKITMLDKKGNVTEFELKAKQLVAIDIADYLEKLV